MQQNPATSAFPLLQEQAATIKKLEEQVGQLQADLDAYTGTDGALAAYDQLLGAVQLYMSEEPDVMAVADSLGKIDEAYVEDGATENFQNVYHWRLQLCNMFLH